MQLSKLHSWRNKYKTNLGIIFITVSHVTHIITHLHWVLSKWFISNYDEIKSSNSGSQLLRFLFSGQLSIIPWSMIISLTRWCSYCKGSKDKIFKSQQISCLHCLIQKQVQVFCSYLSPISLHSWSFHPRSCVLYPGWT